MLILLSGSFTQANVHNVMKYQSFELNRLEKQAIERTDIKFVGNNIFTDKMQPGTVGSDVGPGPQADVSKFLLGKKVEKQPAKQTMLYVRPFIDKEDYTNEEVSAIFTHTTLLKNMYIQEAKHTLVSLENGKDQVSEYCRENGVDFIYYQIIYDENCEIAEIEMFVYSTGKDNDYLLQYYNSNLKTQEDYSKFLLRENIDIDSIKFGSYIKHQLR